MQNSTNKKKLRISKSTTIGCKTNQKKIMGKCWHRILSGKKDTIKRIAEKGVIAVNPNTKKFELIDPNAHYRIYKEKKANHYCLYSNKNLRDIATKKGWIL